MFLENTVITVNNMNTQTTAQHDLASVMIFYSYNLKLHEEQ